MIVTSNVKKGWHPVIILERVGLDRIKPHQEMEMVPHEAKSHQIDLRERALLCQKLAKLLLGHVIEDHLPVQRPGDQVGIDHGGVGGLEVARRSHRTCN